MSDVANRLRTTTEAMASFSSVDMGLWCAHSGAALDAAAEIERLRGLLGVAETQIVKLYSVAVPGGNHEFGNRFADNDPVVQEIRNALQTKGA